MKISRNWLQTFFADPLPDAAALSDALTFHVFEIDGIERVGDDEVLDVKVTANRGHDCLSHRGIAKELSAILGRSILNDSFRQAVSLAPTTDALSITIEDPALCNRYIAGYLRGVTVAPSPEWLRTLLETIGQRSINNIVDATNYVMFTLGQPLHAFDAGKLQAPDGIYEISVRAAQEGEVLHALDGKEYALTPATLVIADASGPVGIAGIKGGTPASITDATTDIIIESANFNGVSVRKSAQLLKLRTDASARFEQVISPELAGFGMKAVVELIVQLAGGEIVGFVDQYPVSPEKKEVSIATAKINATLGSTFSNADISSALTSLDLAHTEVDDLFTVHVPFERLDITIAEDLIEEVGRIMGYDKIPAIELPHAAKPALINPRYYLSETIRAFLVGAGFSEVLTSVFAESGEQVVLNKIDGIRPYLRASLVPGLSDALQKNIRTKDLLSLKQVRLFEIGSVWNAEQESLTLALAVEPLKKHPTAQELLAQLSEHVGITLQSDGLVSEAVVEVPLDVVASQIELPQQYESIVRGSEVRYQPFSKYPFIVRDIALWVPNGTAADQVQDTIASAAGSLLVRNELFDQFEKERRTSFAFRLVFQSHDRTLTDLEVQTQMDGVYAAVAQRGWEVR